MIPRLAVLLLLLLAPGPAGAAEGRVTLLQINDFYEAAPVDGRGGFAPLKALLDRERATARASVTVLSGDFISPSLMSGVTKGAHMIELGNAIGIDLAVPGNHEFDFGPEVFRARMAESRFPWLATNLREADGKPFNGAPENAIRELDGIKVGFLGLITPRTAALSTETGRLVFADPTASATRAVKALRAQGAQAVVALTHLDFAEDRALARAVPGIDLILGGHDHEPITFLEGSTLIHKSGQDGHWLGAVELAVETGPEGEVRVTPSWRMVSTRGVAGDPAIAERVAALEKTFGAALDEPAGACAQALDSRAATARTRESSFGGLVADALREGLKADVAIVNGGGIRGDRQYPAGAVLTRRDLLTELPFNNGGVLVELNGAALRTLLEHALAKAPEASGRFPQVSGLALAFDPARPAGGRLVEAKVAGRPLEDKKPYRLATNDFWLRGGDGQTALAGAKVLVDASAARPVTAHLEDYLKAHRPADLGPGPRIREIAR